MQFKSLAPNLMVDDVAQAMAWYRDTLGFEVVATVPDEQAPVWAMLRAGAVTLMLESRGSIEAGFPQFRGQAPGVTGSLYMDVEDADALYAVIASKARIVKEPHLTFYGAREFYIEDPNGYVLGFASQQPETTSTQQ